MQKVNVLCVFTIQLDGNKWGHVKCSNVTGRRYIATGSSVDGEDFKKSLCWKLEWNAPSLGFYTWRRCPSQMTLKASREKLCCTFAVQHKINTHTHPPLNKSIFASPQYKGSGWLRSKNGELQCLFPRSRGNSLILASPAPGVGGL